MGNRCPDEGKFVSLDFGDPEVDSLDIDGDGNITGNVRLVLNCASCGTEMKEANLEIEDLPAEIDEHIAAHKEAGEDFDLSIEEDSSAMDDRFSADKDRKGKRIPMRFRKHYYIGNVEATVTCSCGKKFNVTLSVEEQASAFEDLG